MAGRTKESPRKKFICKFCKVQVVSKTNKKAIFMSAHKPGCPRRDK